MDFQHFWFEECVELMVPLSYYSVCQNEQMWEVWDCALAHE